MAAGDYRPLNQHVDESEQFDTINFNHDLKPGLMMSNGDVIIKSSHDDQEANGSIKSSCCQSFRFILTDNQSRKLFLFLCITLSFAFVEFLFGIWSNSLSLISDSCHMFFDCSALVGGLAASIISKWSPNKKYSYGYERSEVIGGFVNGLFLMFVAFFIISEAIERLFAPPDVQHDRVLVVSIIGLIVNLIGIFIFNHGHHGHSHGHVCADEHDPLLISSNEVSGTSEISGGDDVSIETGSNLQNCEEKSDCNSGEINNKHINLAVKEFRQHGHSHELNIGKSQLMQGVILHILADTLGSLGVIISAILMSQFNWMIADPICSLFIGTIVALSVLPLLRDSTAVLMQRTPKELDSLLSEFCEKIKEENSQIIQLQDVHIWTLCSGKFVGSMTAIVHEKITNQEQNLIKLRLRAALKRIKIENISIEFEYKSNQTDNYNQTNN